MAKNMKKEVSEKMKSKCKNCNKVGCSCAGKKKVPSPEVRPYEKYPNPKEN